MRRTIAAVIGLTIGLSGAPAMAVEPGVGPVLRELGQVRPTPEPTAEPFAKRRLITTVTVQNSPEGDTQMMFEAQDVGRADSKTKTFSVLAAETYTLTRDSANQEGKRDEVLEALRRLERALLDYVEVAGPPREPRKVVPGHDRP